MEDFPNTDSSAVAKLFLAWQLTQMTIESEPTRNAVPQFNRYLEVFKDAYSSIASIEEHGSSAKLYRLEEK